MDFDSLYLILKPLKASFRQYPKIRMSFLKNPYFVCFENTDINPDSVSVPPIPNRAILDHTIPKNQFWGFAFYLWNLIHWPQKKIIWGFWKPQETFQVWLPGGPNQKKDVIFNSAWNSAFVEAEPSFNNI